MNDYHFTVEVSNGNVTRIFLSFSAQRFLRNVLNQHGFGQSLLLYNIYSCTKQSIHMFSSKPQGPIRKQQFVNQ